MQENQKENQLLEPQNKKAVNSFLGKQKPCVPMRFPH